MATDYQNNRIFYACHAVAFGEYEEDQPNQTKPMVAAHGVQSVGMSTSFNLEQVFELGQVSVYENIEGLPEVEVTLEKVLDGYPLLYYLATTGSPGSWNTKTGAEPSGLVGRTKKRCNVALGIFPDDQEAIEGQAPVEVYMSGMYINGLSYTFPSDGMSTESITLVGNSKAWNSQPRVTNGLFKTEDIQGWKNTTALARSFHEGKDQPVGSGGIQRREDVIMKESIMPKSIYGVDSNDNKGNNWDNVAKEPKAHIQSITISMGDLGREEILELGQKDPYYRTPTFPVEITSEFEVISISGDLLTLYENRDSTPTQRIKIVLRDGTVIDLGTKNRLSSVSYGGGDAGGGNVTQTYSFSTYNDLFVVGPSIEQPGLPPYLQGVI